MMIPQTNHRSLDDHLGCFGDFSMEDPICNRFCALRIRCTIARDENIRMEIFEDLLLGDDLMSKIQ